MAAGGVSEARGRPLRPAALVWSAFGLLPWAASLLLMPTEAGELGTGAGLVLILCAAAFLATAFVVKDRLPVRFPRVATGAALTTFLLAVVRFGVLPFLAESLLARAGDLDARGLALTRILLYTRLLELFFVAAAAVLLATCAHALYRRLRP